MNGYPGCRAHLSFRDAGPARRVVPLQTDRGYTVNVANQEADPAHPSPSPQLSSYQVKLAQFQRRYPGHPAGHYVHMILFDDNVKVVAQAPTDAQRELLLTNAESLSFDREYLKALTLHLMGLPHAR